MESKEYLEKNPEALPYLERLENEWGQYGKIIIAVDYDDTISPWKLRNFDATKTVEVLKAAKTTGAYITVFTQCNPDRYDEIMEHCNSIGLDIDSINKNPVDLPYGDNGKVYANIFIDDRAGINEALNILEMATYRVRSSKRNYNQQDIDF